ncbi:MAG: AAA family ATPase [Saprospirales bacterium]|nr:AAA family ATPase [Saprospirales bacterium]
MPILSGFGLKNFRVFKEETFFELAPITLLTGTNSSGKSSLLKALLLWQDFTKKANDLQLDFSGPDHKLWHV